MDGNYPFVENWRDIYLQTTVGEGLPKDNQEVDKLFD